MPGVEEFNSLVEKYPCCSKLSIKGKECIDDLKRKSCGDRVLKFESDGVYNGTKRFSSYSTGSIFPDRYHSEIVYDEIPNLVMPYGRIGNRTLHRRLGKLVQYQDMSNECKNQMALSLSRLKDFHIVDVYSDTQAYVLDLNSPIDLHYMIESVPLKLKTSELVTLVIKGDPEIGPSKIRCDLRPQRISELKRRYCSQCLLTEPRSNGIAEFSLTRVTPRFSATDLVTSDFFMCEQDLSILSDNEIKYALCLIGKANELIKKHETLERIPNNIAYINSKERLFDYNNLLQILKSLIISNGKLNSKEKYKNLWIAEYSIRVWISERIGVLP